MAASMSSPRLVAPDDRFAVIKFIEEPPKHIFVEKWFDVGISIHMPRSQAQGSLESTFTVQLKPNLYRYTRGKTSSQPVSPSDSVQLTMNPPFIALPLSKTGSPSEHIARAKCKISCPVQSSKPSAFSIQFNAEMEPNPQSAFEVKPSFSQPLSIVNAKLIVESPGWEDIWYKDMGGRDKAMLAVASLVDQDGNIIKDRKVPLHLKLLYDNEERTPVTKQDIFRMVGASCHYIDPETGKASLQFRIEDVSKNHQGQNFIIQIGTDKEKSPDVAPAYSRSVCIRSKKKVKRQRDDHSAPTPTPKQQATQATYPTQPPPATFTAPTNDPFSVGSSHNTQSIRQAMRGVIKWTEEVVNGLGPLKWNVIGYAQNQDGVIDYNRPYHSMPNPNEKVNQILNMYAEDTREHLRVLLNAVEQSTTPSSSEPMYGSGLPLQNSQQHPASSNTPFRPEMRQWQNTYQDHPSYNMQGLVSHESSSMSPPAGQNTHTSTGTSTNMPPLQPMQMQNQYWAQHSSQGMPSHGSQAMQPPLHQRVPLSRDSRPNQGEPDMSDISIDLENRQADVQYVLAKVFKSLRTDNRLGFPAYNMTKELLGFYRESSMGAGSGRFIPIHKHKNEFGREEMEQASRILKEAILKRSRAVYALKDWGSLMSMVEHALVYDWTKDIGGENSGSSGSGDVEIGSPAREYL